MLVELVVENYAVVERLRVRFHRGLNVLTGETGSGKSIVVDALGLLLGGRASAEMVRTGAERARISGIFDLPPLPALHSLLEEAGLDVEENEIIVEREILANGKSRAFAASRPVTAALLRDLAPYLGDIHGQHDQQLLFSPEAQLDMLDGFAGIGDKLAEIGDLHSRWRACSRELEQLEGNEQEKLRLLDLWSFQRKEIETAQLKASEDADLDSERRVLQNVAKLQESAGAAFTLLYDAPNSAYAQMRLALKRVDELVRIDESLREVAETLRPVEIAVKEASHLLRDYLGKLEADPGRLEDVENRLDAIDKLKRKYGATIDEILAFLADVRSRMAALESADERRAAIEKQRAQLAEKYLAAAERLTAQRRAAAQKLEKQVESELKSLAMERTRFQVQMNPAPWSARGMDAIVFLIAPNVGEEPKPLDKIASGGELSRVALALKTCVTAMQRVKDTPRTLVFDEVDAGIGGTAAEMVGRRLKNLSTTNQVLCVTHLAQIAGFGDHHYHVEKHEVKGRTVAEMVELEGESRTREIGRMLAGQRLTPEALKYAEQLLRLSK